MSLSKHPNVLRVRGSWLDEHKLHIALRLMNAGSAADVMQYAWPGGMEEEVVRCILKQALEGLKYVPSDYSITSPYSHVWRTHLVAIYTSTGLSIGILKRPISLLMMTALSFWVTSESPHH
jgi:serine/threonine protein kinase